MIFHIAVCSPDPVLRGRVQRHCMEYYARRADACIVEQLESTAALLQQEGAGSRYELYLIELPAANPCSGLQAAAELRRRGVLLTHGYAASVRRCRRQQSPAGPGRGIRPGHPRPRPWACAFSSSIWSAHHASLASLSTARFSEVAKPC